MLSLTRKLGESIMIGDDIEVKVTRVERGGRYDQIRLSIAAPRNVAIYRRELYDVIRAQGETPKAPVEIHDEPSQP